MLFIDAREIYNQIDRAHREWTSQQIEFLANIVRLYRRKDVETTSHESQAMLGDHFPHGEYVDVQGLCKLVSIEEIDGQSWSLNPGRYVGVKPDGVTLEDAVQKLRRLADEFGSLHQEAQRLSANVERVMGAW